MTLTGMFCAYCTEQRLRIAVANTVVGQILPPGVVKGGASLTIRVGEAGSRFSSDLDVSRMPDMSADDYIAALEQNLGTGWGGFSGLICPLNLVMMKSVQQRPQHSADG